MKIIIAGAGLTGSSVVDYLIKNNPSDDIIVIDNNPKAIKKISSLYDVQTVLGSASNPDVLTQAGAKDADIIMALTDSDEVNMVACQMVYSLFHVPKKIARIESPQLLSPLLKNLYNDKNFPIDYITSTNLAIAQNIYSLIKMPFAKDYATIKDGKISLLTFKIQKDSPIINSQIIELERLVSDIKISILLIIRKNSLIIPTSNEVLKEDDEVTFICCSKNLDTSISAFGKASQSNEHVVVFGANKITELLIDLLEKDSVITKIKLIEEDISKAQDISFKYNDLQVISGSLLSDAILSEANIKNADITISANSEDKDNILTTILSDSFDVPSNISLLNSRVYDNMLDEIKQNISIDKSALISSLIAKTIRKVELDFIYVLSKNYGEVWGLKLKKRIDLKKLSKQKGLKVGIVIRDKEVYYDIPLNGLQRKDYVILFAENKQINKIEELFL